MDDILDEFKEYLQNRALKEYADGTTTNYKSGIRTICKRENINTAKKLIGRIDEVEQKYGETGSEVAFGKKNHNFYINAVRRFNEFVKSNKLGEK